MHRRALLSSSMALAAAGATTMRSHAAQTAAAEPARAEALARWRQFEITTRVSLLDAPGRAQLWLPLAQDAGGMYPCAFTATGQPNCLDAKRFRYEITSRELAA